LEDSGSGHSSELSTLSDPFLGEKYVFTIHVQTPSVDRLFHFAADDSRTLDRWVRAIKTIEDYGEVFHVSGKSFLWEGWGVVVVWWAARGLNSEPQ
jgi:hypothetical protein